MNLSQVTESIDPVFNYALKHITAKEHISYNILDSFAYGELQYILKDLKDEVKNYSNALKSLNLISKNCKDVISRSNIDSSKYKIKENARYAFITYCLFKGVPLCKIETCIACIDIYSIKSYMESVYIECISNHEKYLNSYKYKNPTEFNEIEELEENIYESNDIFNYEETDNEETIYSGM